MAQIFNPEKGTWVLVIFVAFFGLIVAVNSVFIYNALSTHSGVITEDPYRKGLAYNDVLSAAKSQPKLTETIAYEKGVLRWTALDQNGQSLDATVTAKLVRDVKDGHDFDVELNKVNSGTYEAALDLPLKGRWSVQIKAVWDKNQYQTRHTIIAK